MISLRIAALVAAVFVASPHADGASDRCAVGAADAGAVVLKGKATTVVAVPDTDRIAIGEQFALDLMVCSDIADTTVLGVDATMPRHGHGMNYKPSLNRESADRYQVEGLLFHMPGQWRLSVRIEENGKPGELSSDMTIEP